MGPDCDIVRPGGQFDTSEFSLSTQPPSSSGRPSTISVAMNHPADATRQSKNPPPLDESLRGVRQRQMLLPTLLRCLVLIVTREVVSLSNPHIALNRERKGGIV